MDPNQPPEPATEDLEGVNTAHLDDNEKDRQQEVIDGEAHLPDIEDLQE